MDGGEDVDNDNADDDDDDDADAVDDMEQGVAHINEMNEVDVIVGCG